MLQCLQVSFNGTKLPIKTFQDYVNLYPRLEGDAMPRIYERINDRWEVCIGASDGQFRQVGPSFNAQLLPCRMSEIAEISALKPVMATFIR